MGSRLACNATASPLLRSAAALVIAAAFVCASAARANLAVEHATAIAIEPGESIRFNLVGVRSAETSIRLTLDGRRRFRQTLRLPADTSGAALTLLFDTVHTSGDFLPPGDYTVVVSDELTGASIGRVPFRVIPFGENLPAGDARIAAHWNYLESHGAKQAPKRASGRSTGCARYAGAIIPSPYEPIDVVDETLHVLGRTITLGQNGLPAAVHAAGAPLLSAPTALRANGNALSVATPVAFVEESPACVAWRSELRAGNDRYVLTGFLSFDGLLRYSFVAQSEAPQPIALTLNMHRRNGLGLSWGPIQEVHDSADERHGPDYGHAPLVDAATIWPFANVYVLDDAARGIAVIAESRQLYDVREAPASSHCTQDACQFLVRLSAARAASDSPTLGLQILPVRALPSTERLAAYNPLQIPDALHLTRQRWLDAGSYRRSLAAGLDAPSKIAASSLDRAVADGLRTIVVHQGWTGWQGYPGPSTAAERAALKRLCDLAHRRGLRVLAYVGLELSLAAPEWSALAADVAALPLRFGRTRDGVRAIRPAAASNAYRDFLVRHITDLRDDVGIDGVFLDLVAEAQPSANATAGFGFKRGGTRQTELPLLANRELLRALYTLFHEPGSPQGVVACHVSGVFQPSQAFCDYVLAGEAEVAALRRGTARSLNDVMPAAAFSGAYNPTVRGIPIVWMSKPERGGPAFDAMASTILPAGILPRGQWPHFIPAHSSISMLMPARDAAWAWQLWQGAFPQIAIEGQQIRVAAAEAARARLSNGAGKPQLISNASDVPLRIRLATQTENRPRLQLLPLEDTDRSSFTVAPGAVLIFTTANGAFSATDVSPPN
ncbi:MAG: glycoside hydrolase domain-containing protein [Pseudomonadota bacterium]